MPEKVTEDTATALEIIIFGVRSTRCLPRRGIKHHILFSLSYGLCEYINAPPDVTAKEYKYQKDDDKLRRKLVNTMGIITRVKDVPKGAKDTFSDAVENGVPGALLNAIARIGEKNAAARKSLGEDVSRRM